MPNTPTVVIPPGTNRILDSAFHGNTSLQTIHIPASVNEIGDFAFIGATGLRTIHNASTIPQQINDTTFAGVNRANVSVFIPTGTTQAYIAAGWGRFRLVESGALTVSTWAQLRAAVNAAPANTPTIIHITESFSAPTGAAGEAIIIPANRQITLVSAGANAAQASFSTLGEEFLLPQLSLPVLYDSVESIELSPIIGEDVSLRECEFARHYLHEDGTITTALFAQPVNFLDASGAWQDIDNTLQLQRDGTFTPVASSMDIQIPQDATSGLLTIDRGSYSIAFGSTETARSAMVGQLVAVDEMQAEHTVARSRQEQIELSNDYMMQVENLASAVSFGNVEQIVTNGGVHEQITVYQRQREYTYSYNFLMSGLIPVAQENGSFTLYSEVTSEPKFVLQAPFMFDASGEVNGIDFELRDGTVSLRADAEWINTLERTLPVTIVPMSVQPWREGPIRDTYVNSANSLITNTLINFVGSRETGGINRTLMRFDLSSIPNNRVITSANLQITQNRTYSFSSGMNMQIYRLAAAIPASVNWGNQPNLGGLAATQAIVSASGHSYNISITNTARNWHENSASNHGIAIMSGDESRSTRVDLASSRNLLTNNRPSLIVTHAPPVNAVQTITQARSSQRHFIVNGSLTLGSGITLSGGTATNSNNAGGVQVNAGGNFTMNTGSIIENCRRTIIGGAVALAGSGTAVGTRATFTLAGGTIRNNSATNGGGVNLGANSRMTMSSGYIRNNVTTDAASTGSVGGGGVRINSATATFEMTGGTIENNTSARHGGGVHVATNGAAFTMRGGTIRANTAANHGGGVGMSSSTSNRATLLLAGGTIENNTAVNGGGVGTVNISNSLYGPQLTMTSGVIRNNTATTNGGGVHVAAGATFTMNGASARIENNRSTSTTATNGGGGVNLLGSGTDAATRATFTLQNGTISGNEGRSGGGVRVATNGRMNMTGGTITNNRSTATTATGGGGGVYVSSGTIANGMGFNMTGGTISNNTAVNNGGGIFSTLHSTANPVPTTAYANLRITAAARFSGNRSRQAFAPPSNRLAHIATTASVSFGNYALNNHDINYTGS
ncbi:MAG: DNRLRE domain-containing protein [Oscillospiraceae bacterium]|nr:DNRLRE domain-containing protein [Oscillospiraceae bacterium]